jgi:hypothetical protein
MTKPEEKFDQWKQKRLDVYHNQVLEGYEYF